MSYEILPVTDDLNQVLIENARPSRWVNPTPDGRYNLVVIGGGSAGLIAAAGAAGIGGKVALIEKNYLGGDCLNVGCVPSKAIIRAGRAMAEIRKADYFGIDIPHEAVKVDFQKVLRHVRHSRAAIAPHDSAKRYAEMGVDIFFGTGKFTSSNTIDVDGVTLEFTKAVVATGSSAAHIPIPGLAETGYLTNETLWNIESQPESLAVIGAGPIGSEMAQTFQRLGTRVILIDIADHILGREDRDAAAVVQESMKQDGVQLCLGARTTQVFAEDGKKVLIVDVNGAEERIVVEEILLAVGRKANVDGLNLEGIGVEVNKQGIIVNDHLQTTNPNIYAAGDVAGKPQFTHLAGHSGAIVVQNALFPVMKRKFSDLIVPWVTFTDPEIAHVGLYPHEAAEQGIEIDTYQSSMGAVDRAIAENATEGLVKVHTKKGTDKIVGATIVSQHAGEMITEVTLAMKHDLGLSGIYGTIHPYPTEAEALTKVGSLYNRTRLTPTVKNLFSWWLKRTR